MLQTYINIMKGQTIPQKKNTLAITLSDKRTKKRISITIHPIKHDHYSKRKCTKHLQSQRYSSYNLWL